MLTSLPREQVAATLTDLVSPLAVVNAQQDYWMPAGFLNPEEARLGECPPDLLAVGHQRELIAWWLRRVEGANTPNWDLACTCRIEGKPGLILVEAKAHGAEAKIDGKPKGNSDNDRQIQNAVRQANDALNRIITGWQLSCESHYQLCNRFAWAWKLSTLGVPIVLIYLGFLRCTEMLDHGQPFDSPQSWSAAIRRHASDIVPVAAWDQRLQSGTAPMWALVRSLDLRWVSGTCAE